MSHAFGKMEVVGLDDFHIYLRYHRAPEPRDTGEFIVVKRNDRGYWFDDFEIVSVVDSGIGVTSTGNRIKATRDSRIKVLSS